MDELNEMLKKIVRLLVILLRLLVFTLAVLIGFGSYSIYDRRVKTEELKHAEASSRQMLNARARIQIILINANLEGRRLNATEIDQIKVLWQQAEYDQAVMEEK